MQRIVFSCFFLFLFLSCNKKSNNGLNTGHPVPSVPVAITVYPNNVSNFKIQAIGGGMYLSGGIRGIILYRKSQEEFVAMERTSSYLPNNDDAIVKVQPNNFTLRDTVSGSEWRIIDGTITKGPTQWPLR
ncbi:MAG: hypothetical protein WCR21_10950, partial [Bacteroidota bacterium]